MPFFYPVTNKAPQLSSRTLIKLKLKVEIKEHLGLRREASTVRLRRALSRAVERSPYPRSWQQFVYNL